MTAGIGSVSFSVTKINYLIFVKITFLYWIKSKKKLWGEFSRLTNIYIRWRNLFLDCKKETHTMWSHYSPVWSYKVSVEARVQLHSVSTEYNNSASDEIRSRYSLEVIKILYRHRDFILRGEEKTVADLSGVLCICGFGCGVVVVVLQPCLHLCLVQTGNNFVDDVLKRLVSPVTNKLSWNLLKHNNLFMLLKISDCHSMN